MEIYTCNKEICQPGNEFFVRAKAFFPQSSEFSPQMGEIFVRRIFVREKTISPLKLLASYFWVASLVILFANTNTTYETLTTPIVEEDTFITEAWNTKEYNLEELFDLMNYYVEWRSYVVQSGDTLWAIAEEFTGNGLAYHAIEEKNQMRNPNLIFPGDKIIIPVLHPINE